MRRSDDTRNSSSLPLSTKEGANASVSFLDQLKTLDERLKEEIKRLEEEAPEGTLEQIDEKLDKILRMSSDDDIPATEEDVEELEKLKREALSRRALLAIYHSIADKLASFERMCQNHEEEEENSLLNDKEIQGAIEEFNRALTEAQAQARAYLEGIGKDERESSEEEDRLNQQRKAEREAEFEKVEELLALLRGRMEEERLRPPTPQLIARSSAHAPSLFGDAYSVDDVDSHPVNPPHHISFFESAPPAAGSRLSHAVPSRLVGVDAVPHAEFIRRIPQLFNEADVICSCEQINEDTKRVLKKVVGSDVSTDGQARDTVNTLMHNAQTYPVRYYSLKLKHLDASQQNITYCVHAAEPASRLSLMNTINSHLKHTCDLGEKCSLKKILEGIRFLQAVGHKKIDLTQVNKHEKLDVPGLGSLTLLQIADAYSRKIGLEVTQPERVPLYPVNLAEKLEEEQRNIYPSEMVPDDVDSETFTD